ncbi:MAG: hypothetical protein ACLUUO_07230 [Sellimonas intestinalis]
MIREWKTVVIALVSIGAIALICFTVGSLIFGREYALISASPVAGSTVAGIIATGAAEAANRPELAAFAVLVLSVQKFFGIPISTFCIRKDLGIKRQQGYFKKQVETTKALRLPSMRIFKETPKNLRTNTIYICKVALVACLADFVGKATLIHGIQSGKLYFKSKYFLPVIWLDFCKNRVSRKGYFCQIRIFWHYYVWSAFDASGQSCPGITIQPVEV